MSQRFPYPKMLPSLTFAFALMLAGAALGLTVMAFNLEALWTLGLTVILFFAVAVVYASPLLTEHSIDGAILRLRFGIIFRADVPLEGIVEARVLEPHERVKGLDLVTERSRRVLIQFRERRRFPHALYRSANAIVVSVNDPVGFAAALGGGMGR
jgi:hypothetical protein